MPLSIPSHIDIYTGMSACRKVVLFFVVAEHSLHTPRISSKTEFRVNINLKQCNDSEGDWDRENEHSIKANHHYVTKTAHL